MKIRMICIDDRNKPEGVLSSNWVKRGNIYTVTGYNPFADGYSLEEISPGVPYMGYATDRFEYVDDLFKDENISMVIQCNTIKDKAFTIDRIVLIVNDHPKYTIDEDGKLLVLACIKDETISYHESFQDLYNHLLDEAS